jgi:hypothetical protein
MIVVVAMVVAAAVMAATLYFEGKMSSMTIATALGAVVVATTLSVTMSLTEIMTVVVAVVVSATLYFEGKNSAQKLFEVEGVL